MTPWQRRALILGATIVVLAMILFGFSFLGANYLVDIWWFESLGYAFYYWQRLLYRYVVFAAVTLLFFLIFFLNFWVASRYLGATMPPTLKKQVPCPQSLPGFVQDVSGGLLLGLYPGIADPCGSHRLPSHAAMGSFSALSYSHPPWGFWTRSTARTSAITFLPTPSTPCSSGVYSLPFCCSSSAWSCSTGWKTTCSRGRTNASRQAPAGISVC